MPSFLSPHHVQLIVACYPPSAALLTSAPDYKPNSQELSRLTYYASNRPSKINRISTELQKRISADVKKARSGNSRSRASLLITLNIFKALVSECRGDLPLLSAPLMNSLDVALAALFDDFEVAAKLASVFAAWTTYTNGQLLGADQGLTRDYISVLSRFSRMSKVEMKSNDLEDRNRVRLIGLGALTRAIASEALYNSSSQFKTHVSVIVPALLSNVFEMDINVLNDESEHSEDLSNSLPPHLLDFRSRPLLERRAASIHLHVEGESGPSMREVVRSALRALSCLFTQSNGVQVGCVLQAIFECLATHDQWYNLPHCFWLISKAVQWTQYPYRFAIATRLVDKLVEAHNDPSSSLVVLKALTVMLKTTLTSTVPLVNLSTSDICSNLCAIMLRRVANNSKDDLLPELVDCIGALGTHLYYADQIHDLACELIGRLVNIETNGIGAKGRVYFGLERAAALRCLIAALSSLIRTSATSHYPASSGEVSLRRSSSVSPSKPGKTRTSLFDRSQRTKVPPNVWQETLTLLCDENIAVRADYARMLILYLKSEIQVEDLVRDSLSKVDGPYQRILSERSFSMGESNSTTRFFHALYASLYVLATSPRLGLLSSTFPTPIHSLDRLEGESDQTREDSVQSSITPPTVVHDALSGQEDQDPGNSQVFQASRRKSMNLTPQAKKLQKIRRLLDASAYSQSSVVNGKAETASAGLSDYRHILVVMQTVLENYSHRALVTGLPMLFALHSWCETEYASRERRIAIDHVMVLHLRDMARFLSCSSLLDVSEKASFKPWLTLELPGLDIPTAETDLESTFPIATTDTDTIPHLLYDEEAITSIVSMDTKAQRATGLDQSHLKRQLRMRWTLDDAIPLEASSSGEGNRSDFGNPVLKISPALMQISNLSLQSLARSSRGVGVSDLREALEGRGGMSSVALSQGRAPSIASLSGTHSAASADSSSPASRLKSHGLRGGNPEDVRSVLTKLGIGAKKEVNPVKSSKLSSETVEARSTLIPPYLSS